MVLDSSHDGRRASTSRSPQNLVHHLLHRLLGDGKARRRRGVAGAVGVLALGVALPVASFADSGTGCDFAQNGTDACSQPLSGSTFAGGDGNLLTNPTDFGTTDWQNVGRLNIGVDLPSGSGDNSFGQGTKEDNPTVSVVSGSIPPNKSDLTRFYEASESASNNNYLYLAWERTNVLGSANFDFEINQKAQPDLTTTGTKTLNRTAGDLLVTFDFTNGGGKPTIGLLTWVTSGAASQCFSSKTVPCWGNEKTLGSDAIAAVNTDTVTDPAAPGAPTLPGLTFGETAINLTAAGVFPAGTCKAFGSAFVRSRSSASFTAEVKDFVAPIPVDISNCGRVTIIKHTDPRGVDQGFSYSSTVTGTTTADGTTACPTGSQAFTLNDSGNTSADSTANTNDCFNVPTGSYTVTEGSPPPGYALESLTCTTGGSQNAVNPLQADISVTPDAHVTCTYVNKQQLGAIEITKTSSKAAATPLAGATFSIKDPNGNALSGSPFTTNAGGTICVDGLTFGDYSVKETGAPTGYAIDDSTTHTVTVDTNAGCKDATYAGEALSFTDTPLTDVVAKATSEVAGGTQSKFTCVDSSNAGIGNSPQGFSDPAEVDANGLKPGTYTCTIVVDP